MLWAAKNSGVARVLVASSATALAPFSQNSAVCRWPTSGSGTRVAHMIGKDFFGSEKSVTVSSATEARIEFVDAARITELNVAHRGKEGPTDVLSFPIDEDGDVGFGPRELGDVLICPEHTTDLREAIVHGALHLVGMDHEVDDGEMLAIQAELLSW